MRRSRAARGDGKIGCVIWIAILALLGYGLYWLSNYLRRPSIAKTHFHDAIQ